jgi:hypothetical protein
MRISQMPVSRTGSLILLLGVLPLFAKATENLPRIPFAESARLPDPNQFVVSPWYYYNVFRKLWIGDAKTSIEIQPQQDFELNDGMITVDYGVTPQIALDLTLGYTSAATRSWDPQADPKTTEGLMDTQLGIRYRLLDEREFNQWYIPTLTLRLGGIIKGTYDADFPIAPGDGASGGEAAIMIVKTTQPLGVGYYADGGYRLRDNHVPQTIFGAAGLSETLHFNWLITSVTINVGYRGLYDLNGPDFTGGRVAGVPHDFIDFHYTRTAQEIYQMGEVGLGMSDKKGRRYFFSCAHPFDGRNTPKVNNFVIGLNWPLGSHGK